jgi:hypothetical protein
MSTKTALTSITTSPTPSMEKASSTVSTVASSTTESVVDGGTATAVAGGGDASASASIATAGGAEQSNNAHAGQHKELRRLSVVDTATLREIVPNAEPIVLDVSFLCICSFVSSRRGLFVCLVVMSATRCEMLVWFTARLAGYLSIVSDFQRALVCLIIKFVPSLHFLSICLVPSIENTERLFQWSCDAPRQDTGR